MLVDARRAMLRRCSFGEDGDRLGGSTCPWISKPTSVITRVDTELKHRKRTCRKRMDILCIFIAVWKRQSCGDNISIFAVTEIRGHCIYEKAPSRGTGKNRLSQNTDAQTPLIRTLKMPCIHHAE